MKEANVWSYVNIGTGFRYLQDAKMGRRVHGVGNIAFNIDRFLDSLDRLGLKVSLTAWPRISKRRSENRANPSLAFAYQPLDILPARSKAARKLSARARPVPAMS
jgi:hypothetical protein